MDDQGAIGDENEGMEKAEDQISDDTDGKATIKLEIPKKTNFLTLHSSEFEIHSPVLTLQDGTVLDNLGVESEKKAIVLNVRLPCEVDPQKDACLTFTYTVRLTTKSHDMPEITLQIDPQITAIVTKAKEEGRKASADDLGELTSDSNFLNNLQGGVNKWINEIRRVTRLDHEPSSGTAIQETTFWTNIEKELNRINEMRESEEVVLTLEALKLGKRFHATISFDADTGLKEMVSQAADYNQVMKDIPLNDLMAAMDIATLHQALTRVLSGFKKIRNTKYPAKRAIDFYAVISSDLCTQLIKILRPQRLLHMEMTEFNAVMQSCKKLFTYWDDEQQHLQGLFREMAKKQKVELKYGYFTSAVSSTASAHPGRVTLRHTYMEARLGDLLKFRHEHEQLSNVIARVIRSTASAHRRAAAMDLQAGGAGAAGVQSEHNNPARQVARAYDDIKEIDYLDIGKEGFASWEAAMRRYKEQISRIETQLAMRLREQLGNAKSADEMFNIFSRYNVLFVRPNIRTAIREFQTQLIECVKKDIDELQTKYLGEECTSLALNAIRRLDIPDFSSRVMWYRQIENMLATYMKRVEDVLGDQWANHVEGKELKKESEILKQKLDTKPMFEEWAARVQNKCKTPSNRLYLVEKLQRDGKVICHLKVNYAPETIVIAKEVRNLKNMGFRLPFKIMSLAHTASTTYPYAISLLESVRVYDSTNEAVQGRKGVDGLVSNYRRTVHELLNEGYNMQWDNYKIETYVTRMAEATNTYHEKVYDLIEMLDGIDVDMGALDTCQYSHMVVGQLLASIQKKVDQLVVGKYSNLRKWVEEVDKAIETKLARRCEEAIHVWTRALNRTLRSELVEEEERDSEKIHPEIEPIKLDIRISSQLITVMPSLENARFQLLNQLYAWHGVVTSQPRILHSQFKLYLTEHPTYESALAKMQHQERVMREVMESINKVLASMDEYVTRWTQYQALWDLQPDSLFERLGETELQNWMTAIVEIKAARRLVDTQESEYEIFPFIIDYARVQTKISVKYEYWQREVLQKFGTLLGTAMRKFFDEVSKWRSDLELQSLDSTSTSDTVALITYVQSLKKQIKPYQEQVDKFVSGERLLTHNRYPFPKAWLYAENVEGEWSALLEILSRKDVAIQSQVSNLQARIAEEDRALERQIGEMLTEWNRSKPLHGSSRPKEAISALNIYDERFKKMRDDLDNVVRAKTALEMTDALGVATAGDQNKLRLDSAVEELHDLLGVWKALLPVYDELDEMKEKPWTGVQPRKVRILLDEQLASLKQFPSQFRSYEAYDSAKRLIQHYSKMNVLVVELKSEALKERHWKQLMTEMKVNWVLSELTLGQVWEADLTRHEHSIKQVLYVAQGELALEEFMRLVKEYWTNFVVDLVNYQQKTKLIRGWDDLFNKLKEHMSSLAAMKLSPYFKQFEEEALAWEERLNKINALFDVWIDVQRRWVYLEGLFTGSADIAYLLPTESSRFNVVSAEFLGMMKKVAASPRILEVVNIQGAQRIFERLAEMLAKIQKALGEYLERERSSFPRFYFVGDEDLLEILGNSKDILRVQKHMKKMFAGIVGIEWNEETRLISAMFSREGERVKLQPAVNLNEIPRVNDWLRKLEQTMQSTLAKLLESSLADFPRFVYEEFMRWLDTYPAQIVCLSLEIWWTKMVEADLAKGAEVTNSLELVQKCLSLLSESVLREQPPLRRKKIEMLITEFVHNKDVCRELIAEKVTSVLDFNWLKSMRFYFNPQPAQQQQQKDGGSHSDPNKCCVVKMADGQFNYGFEYLGVQEKLVQTPLTDRCYLTMTQALHCRLGGSPFGPAGTGKTETVKALGHHLGRFVLVFNCDETFDFQAIGRILVGLCQVGAWGCFDEFNRLEERMLSAVSQQIQTIQEAIKAGGDMRIDLIGKTLSVNSEMAIFITMNPGYSGRSNLPDNLKQLFRSLAMTQPDRKLIAEVMLFSQGFQSAEVLAQKIVPLFTLCQEQLSNQCHYDFGLRALKYVLVSAGNIKRDEIQRILADGNGGELVQQRFAPEQQTLIQSVCETLVPKLVAEDITLLFYLLQDVFPDVKYLPKQMKKLRDILSSVCERLFLCYSTNPDDKGYQWMEKVLQLYQITNLNHGLMLVGPSGSGKTLAWKVLLKSLELLEQVEGVAHVIDAKAMNKEALYGVLDPNTREWTDGLFTHIIRRIVDNVRGEADKRQWIIFDGDVDPEWVENLNSVLDDNKLLTLPNGERLAIPPNVRIIFEVADLKYATLATVSRCGMVWFSGEIVTSEMLFDNYLGRLNSLPLVGGVAPSTSNYVDELLARIAAPPAAKGGDEQLMTASTITTPSLGGLGELPALPATGEEKPSRELELQRQCAQILAAHMSPDGLVPAALAYSLHSAQREDHVMEASKERLLMAFFSLTDYTVKQLIEYDRLHSDFPLSAEQTENFIARSMLVNIVWAMGGDGGWKCRKALSDFIRGATSIALPPNDALPIVDFNVSPTGGWEPWSSKVPSIEVEAHRVGSADVVIPTMDTVRHELLLRTWLSERKPLVLCGPPGSGKTMTLLSTLRSLHDMEVINVNFSSSTSPELLLRNLDHYCEYRRTPNGMVLAPVQQLWLVIFCDEINLPSPDKYGTQRVISFMRQLVEQNGFYRPSDKTWVTLERIQFVGACNPPTDPGRNPLSTRFLRHIPVVYVDYPGRVSLKQIYGTFNRAMLRAFPAVRGLAEPLTDAMVELYLRSQEHFTQDDQPHYVYSPRELTRWVRGISEAIAPLDALSTETLVRLWAHEALRLFMDRLVHVGECEWTDALVDEVAKSYFGACNLEEALRRPILYSCWLTRHYMPVSHEELDNYVRARLKGFYEEELDVKLALYDEMLDHVLRIDRIYRQPQGHLLLIGVSGSGKTTLARFVAWLNGLSVFQLKVHSKYTGADFDEDIRHVLRRVGCRNEKVCFIMDESNMLDTGFLERLNTLLANGEVPGLFEGDEFTTLINQIKEGSQRQGLMLDSTEELYKWFTSQIIRNLHVVFTMNPSGDSLRQRASTSPALFNRCVLNWFGDWSNKALYQVGMELTSNMDITSSGYVPPAAMEHVCDALPKQHIQYHHAVINSFVHVHNVIRRTNDEERKRGHKSIAVTPRHFLDFIQHYTCLFGEKRSGLEDEKIHINIGLRKIQETQEQVKELQLSLNQKGQELNDKKQAAEAKLKQMLADQAEAESEKKVSESLQRELSTQLKDIAQKKEEVGAELATVEPIVQSAKDAVQGIKKSQLAELKSMVQPPSGVKLALESICLLMDDDAGSDWKKTRGTIVKDDFISRILLFNTESLTPEIVKAMERYEQNPDWDYERVNRASVACGPLIQWMKAQLAYYRILSKVDPLRRELKRLENDAIVKTKKGEELKTHIAAIEERIATYKEEYAQLIGQSEGIKADLVSVEQKVERSTRLLNSLKAEKTRWEEGSQSFTQQMSTLVGDVLLSSAFLSYCGYFDQHLREVIFQRWIDELQVAQIAFRPELARIEYLSTADDRLQWVNNGISKDDLCMENCIMLQRFNRYPLIVDPSGQSVDYITKQFPNVIKTSFQDNSFRKNLESALRFGSALLVQDVESYDPVLNPVLNREVKRNAGRVLITLGDQDIDFSPAFKIFLFTRDSSVEFPPDVCSRVTFVNFTITRGSLEMQCLNQVLRSERPDIDEKRSDLLKLQGEFAARLRQLEKALLNALNESRGKILDDDSIITTLERLKHEAEEVAKKSSETDKVMKEVEIVSQRYHRLAHACSLVYMTLNGLSEVHFLYNFSLEFLLEIFSNALKSSELTSVKDHDQRLGIITKNLFKVCYARVSHGMLHSDKVLLALLLLRIYLRTGVDDLMSRELPASYDEQFDHLLLRADLTMSKSLQAQAAKLDIRQMVDGDQSRLVALLNLSRLGEFKKCVERVREQDPVAFTAWLHSGQPELAVPELWQEEKEKVNPVRKAINELLVIHALRPDRLPASAHILVATTMGTDFMEQDKVVSLKEIVEHEVPSRVPVLMCSTVGFDVSARVEDLALETNREVTSIAIGSAEGFNQADAALASASKSGRWVLLKNVHLAASWLTQLAKKLHGLKPHPQFRLLMTAEINPKLPISVIQASRVVVFEPSTGLKANLLRSLSSIPATRMAQQPAERSRLYFLICWFHAVVQERLRYRPLGWAHSYEFSDADLRVAFDTLDSAVDSVALGRANVKPDKLPWNALRTLLSQCIYGGKIDNRFDQMLLDGFLDKIFTPSVFEHGYVLVTDIDGKTTPLHVPDETTREKLLAWVNNIRSVQMPTWIGLPNSAEKVVLTLRGRDLLRNMLKVSGEELAYAEAAAEAPTTADAGKAGAKAPWMHILAESCQRWLKELPTHLSKPKRTKESIKDPLFRFFEREITTGQVLLTGVRGDLASILAVCRAEQKQDNHLRALISALNKGQLPSAWATHYKTPKEIGVAEWVADFAERMKQLARLADAGDTLREERVWLGGLFSPAAYVTATRQLVAQSSGWSLEQLQMEVETGGGDSTSKSSHNFAVEGLHMIGAVSEPPNRIKLSDEVHTRLDEVSFSWALRKQGASAEKATVSVPVYLYSNRADFLFCFDFQPAAKEAGQANLFIERGVAIVCNGARQ